MPKKMDICKNCYHFETWDDYEKRTGHAFAAAGDKEFGCCHIQPSEILKLESSWCDEYRHKEIKAQKNIRNI